MQQYDFSKDQNIDYKFADLIETTRIELKSEVLSSNVSPDKKLVKTILYYSGHIITAYVDGGIIDIFKVNGPLLQ